MELKINLDYEGLTRLGVEAREDIMKGIKGPYNMKRLIKEKTNQFMRYK